MKQPPILYGANVYGQRHEIAARRAYCKLQQNLNLEYVEVPTNINIQTMRHWAHLDGFYISTRKHGEIIRIYRAIRVSLYGAQKQRTRIVKLGRKDRFGFSHIKPGECVTYGPFFSTPLNYRPQWKEYINYRVRKLQKGSYEIIEREVQNFYDPIEFGTAYIVRRIL